MIDGANDELTKAITVELAAWRIRGVERLDVRTHNQEPVETPELDRLATEYMSIASHQAQGRVAQAKYLLRDALDLFAVEDEADAKLIRALFFGDSLNLVTKSAGELLDIARRESGFDSELRFRQVRYRALGNLANFLPGFVASARQNTQAIQPVPAVEVPPSHQEIVPDPEVQQHVASTGYIDTGEHFITLLSQAVNVTIVGYTNENLAPLLETALERKRAAMLRPDGIWDSIRIVFISDELVNAINGGENSESDDALRRRRAAIHGRRTVNLFLRSLPETHWAIYDSPYYPPFTGTLFEMPEGKRIVQLIIRRPNRSPSGHLYLQLEDTRGYYFSATFEEIVHGSVDENKMVPVGYPHEQRFRVTSNRRRQDVLKDGSSTTGWLALVLVITWRVRNGHAEPLLQLRTQLNAIRELNHLTHLPDYITHTDPARGNVEFGLHDEASMATARRRVEAEAGEGEPGELDPIGTCSYLNSDKEHLFFFIYGCRLPEGFQLWRQADMHPVSVQYLLSIRKYQALRKALMVCANPPVPRRLRAAAVEIAASNLILHGHMEAAARMLAATRVADLRTVAAELGELEQQARQALGDEVAVDATGLSGLQFREFYTILLPYYVRAGVPGAAEELILVREDQLKSEALNRLAELYHDDVIMQGIPYEL